MACSTCSLTSEHCEWNSVGHGYGPLMHLKTSYCSIWLTRLGRYTVRGSPSTCLQHPSAWRKSGISFHKQLVGDPSQKSDCRHNISSLLSVKFAVWFCIQCDLTGQRMASCRSELEKNKKYPPCRYPGMLYIAFHKNIGFIK